MKRFQQDDIIKTRERIMTEYGIKDPARRRDLRKTANQPKINKKIADIADRKDESIAMRIKKKRTAKQLKASRDESYGKFGSKMKKKGKINR